MATVPRPITSGRASKQRATLTLSRTTRPRCRCAPGRHRGGRSVGGRLGGHRLRRPAASLSLPAARPILSSLVPTMETAIACSLGQVDQPNRERWSRLTSPGSLDRVDGCRRRPERTMGRCNGRFAARACLRVPVQLSLANLRHWACCHLAVGPRACYGAAIRADLRVLLAHGSLCKALRVFRLGVGRHCKQGQDERHRHRAKWGFPPHHPPRQVGCAGVQQLAMLAVQAAATSAPMFPAPRSTPWLSG